MNPGPHSNVFAAAVQWLEGLLLGSVATIIGVLGVACLGLLLMSGRIDVRRAVQVIFGCFVLFGASSPRQESLRQSAETPVCRQFLLWRHPRQYI